MAKIKMKTKKTMDSVDCAPTDDTKWKAESDHRTLREAKAIEQDEERLEAALSHGKKEMKTMKSVQDIRNYANKAAMEKDEEDNE